MTNKVSFINFKTNLPPRTSSEADAKLTTNAIGEEGGGFDDVTTMAMGEEGGEPGLTTNALGEEGGGFDTSI